MPLLQFGPLRGVKVIALAQFSATPGGVVAPAPTLGQQTREVLLEFGFGEEEIGRLAPERAIGLADWRGAAAG